VQPLSHRDHLEQARLASLDHLVTVTVAVGSLPAGVGAETAAAAGGRLLAEFKAAAVAERGNSSKRVTRKRLTRAIVPR